MTRISTCVLSVFVLLVPALAYAQTSQQQAEAVATINAVGQNVWLDGVVYGNASTPSLNLYGWGWEACDVSKAQYEVVVTSEATGTIYTYPSSLLAILPQYRFDVWQHAVNDAHCDPYTFSAFAGVTTIINIGPLPSGTYIVQLKLKNANGVATLSNPKVFIKP